MKTSQMPTLTPTPVTAPSSSKLPLILLGLLLILSAGAGGVYLGKQLYAPNPPAVQIAEPTATPTATPTLSAEASAKEGDPTANWKTYTNSDLSFKYPLNWSMSESVISSDSPQIKLVVVPGSSTLMNECMEEVSAEIKNGLTVKKFRRATTGTMCETPDSTPREIWIMPSPTKYSPGISYEYSSTEEQQAETFFDQILSTFHFLK